MRVAVVDIASGLVTNVIVASADDPAYPGTVLVALDDDAPVSDGWSYADGGFSPPDEPA